MSEKVDISIIIVHATGVEMLRQTLRGVRSAAPRLNYEIIVVDNNTELGLLSIIKKEFPEVKYLPMERNIGFGAGMNRGIEVAEGRYVLIFNPDIVLLNGSLEELFDFMEKNQDVGIVGPRLMNPDGSLQYSCYRLPTLLLPVYRRTFLGKLPFAKKVLDEYFMVDSDHNETMEVDALLGGAMFARKSMLMEVGLFDERYFLYYEDNDLCREFWKNNCKVVYHPRSEMIHYHRRETADGGFWRQLFSWLTLVQISSFIKYIIKHRGCNNPRLNYGESESISKNSICTQEEVEG